MDNYLSEMLTEVVCVNIVKHVPLANIGIIIAVRVKIVTMKLSQMTTLGIPLPNIHPTVLAKCS